MENKQPWIHELKGIHGILDENSIQYREKLDKLNLEREIKNIRCDSFLYYACLPNVVLEEAKYCGSYIDKNIYIDAKEKLKEASIVSSVDSICCLLKHAYCKTILADINFSNRVYKKAFDKDFKEFIAFINKNVSTITLKTKNARFDSNNKNLINLILSSFKEKIKVEDDISIAALTLTDEEEHSDIYNNVRETIANELIFNLVLHIKQKTDFKGGASNIDTIEKISVSDPLLKLVYDLISLPGFLGIKHDSIKPRVFMRKRFERYMDDNQILHNLFRNDDVTGSLDKHSRDYWEKYMQKYIAHKQRINR